LPKKSTNRAPDVIGEIPQFGVNRCGVTSSQPFMSLLVRHASIGMRSAVLRIIVADGECDTVLTLTSQL
jgi:hypothetical protein